MIVIVPQRRIACELNQASAVGFNRRRSLCVVEDQTSGVNVGEVAHPVKNGPSHQIDGGGAGVVKFNPFAVWEICPVVGGVWKNLGELNIKGLAWHQFKAHRVQLFLGRVGCVGPQAVGLHGVIKRESLDGGGPRNLVGWASVRQHERERFRTVVEHAVGADPVDGYDAVSTCCDDVTARASGGVHQMGGVELKRVSCCVNQ